MSNQHVRNEKRARQKEGRKLNLENKRQQALKARRRKQRNYWIVAAVIVIGFVLVWYFLIRDDSSDDSSNIQDTSAQTEPTQPPQDTTGQASQDASDSTDDSQDPVEGENSTATTTTESDMPIYTPFLPSDYGNTPCPDPGGPAQSGSAQLSFADSFQSCLDSERSYTAVLDTTAGEIRVELDNQNTPGTANNFVSLARAGYYDGTLLHRTDPSIGIIQGGSPHTNNAADPGPGYTIKDEGTEFTYRAGQLVMARTGAPNSSGAQFFFAVNENTALLDSQGVYVVFGNTVAGQDVLDAILASHRDDPSSSLGGAPDPEVTVNSVRIEES